MTAGETHRAIEATFRIERARLIAGLVRVVGDVDLAEELVKAGVFVAAAGLKNDAQSRRIVSDGSSRTVIDGPFAESRELVVGFSIWEVKDMDEAMAWARRAPNGTPGQKTEMEIRPFYEAEDLADFITPEERAAPRDGERGRLGVA